MAGFDVKQTDRNDLGVMGGGLLVLLSSFMPWYGASVAGFGSASVTGWGAGFTAWFSILLSIALAVLVLLRVMKTYELPQLPTGHAVLSLGVAAFALLLVIIRWLSLPSGGYGSFHYGPRIGLFLGLIGIAGQAVFAFLAFKASGEKVEWKTAAAATGEATETPAPPAPPAPPAQSMPTQEEPQDPVAG